MLKKIKDNLFYIGAIILSLTLFAEQFTGATNVMHFIKGFACGIELVGVVILFQNRTVRNN